MLEHRLILIVCVVHTILDGLDSIMLCVDERGDIRYLRK